MTQENRAADDSSLPEYAVPEWDDYECQATGQCCHGWIVEVTEEDRRRIESALEDNPHPEWGKTMPLDEEDRTTLRVEEGHCPYLTEDGLCWLHREFDGETKPTICQTFPENQIKTPLGLFKNIRLSCVSAAGMLDDEQYTIEPSNDPIPTPPDDLEPFYFEDEKPMTPATYRALERTILSLLERDELTVGGRLAAIGKYLRTISRRLDDAPDGDGFTRINRRFTDRELPRPDTSVEGHARIIQMILDFRKENIGLLRQVDAHYEVNALIKKLERIYGFDEDGPETVANHLLSIKRQRWDPVEDQHEPILRHYLQRKIWSKTLTYPIGLKGGISVLATLYAMIRLVSMATAEQNDTRVEKWQLLSAIVKVERCFTHSGDSSYLWSKILDEVDDLNRWFIPYLSKVERT